MEKVVKGCRIFAFQKIEIQMNNTIQKTISHKTELKKHVSTIHCANSLSLLQRKIANALLFHAYEDLLLQNEYQISIKDLCSLIGYDSHDYKSIKKALIDLLSTVIEWNIIEEGLPESEGEWNASSIIADASIKGSICRYSYSNRMKQLLYMPAIYGRLNMQIQSQFKSNYGLALYENVVRYQNISQTPWFELSVFRKLMGVALDKYPIFRDFKRRVIDKAVSEVNTIANLTIEPEFRRHDRNVVSLRFKIAKTFTQKSQIEQTAVRSDLAIRLTTDYGLNEKQVQLITVDYDENYILEKIELIEASSSYTSGKIINLGKYLLHALQDNYQIPRTSTEKKHGKATVFKLNQQKHAEDEEFVVKKTYQAYVDSYLTKQLATLPETSKQRVLDAFASHIENLEIVKKLFQKEGLKNKIIFIEFKNFIRQNHPELLEDVMTMEDFLKRPGTNV